MSKNNCVSDNSVSNNMYIARCLNELVDCICELYTDNNKSPNTRLNVALEGLEQLRELAFSRFEHGSIGQNLLLDVLDDYKDNKLRRTLKMLVILAVA